MSYLTVAFTYQMARASPVARAITCSHVTPCMSPARSSFVRPQLTRHVLSPKTHLPQCSCILGWRADTV